MAYTRNNYLKTVARIIALYEQHKEPDVPDTKIVRHVFPQYGIHISYRTWMIYKGLKPSEYQSISQEPHNQLSLFSA